MITVRIHGCIGVLGVSAYTTGVLHYYTVHKTYVDTTESPDKGPIYRLDEAYIVYYSIHVLSHR